MRSRGRSSKMVGVRVARSRGKAARGVGYEQE